MVQDGLKCKKIKDSDNSTFRHANHRIKKEHVKIYYASFYKFSTLTPDENNNLFYVKVD